jgi:hypothetical protein
MSRWAVTYSTFMYIWCMTGWGRPSQVFPSLCTRCALLYTVLPLPHHVLVIYRCQTSTYAGFCDIQLYTSNAMPGQPHSQDDARYILGPPLRSGSTTLVEIRRTSRTFAIKSYYPDDSIPTQFCKPGTSQASARCVVGSIRTFSSSFVKSSRAGSYSIPSCASRPLISSGRAIG